MNDLRRTDEDAWVIPDEWLAKATPFRGRGPVKAPKIDPKAVALYRKWLADDRVGRAVEATGAAGYRDLAEAARVAIETPEDATALGIAVAGALAAGTAEAYASKPNLTGKLVDAWVDAHGVVAAAEAVAVLAGLSIGYSGKESTCTATRPERPHPFAHPGVEHLPRMRAHLAAASDSDYRAAGQRLGRCRKDPAGLAVCAATAYLLPTEQDWVSRDIRLLWQRYSWGTAEILIAGSVTTSEQLEQVPRPRHIWHLTGRAEILRAVVETGAAATELLTALLDASGMTLDDQRMMADLLAHLPTDQALDVLVDRADRPGVRIALLEAMYRFPRRAARLLAQRPPDTRTSGLSSLLARVYPELADEEIAAPAGAKTPVDLAPMAELPELLRTPPWERDLPPMTPTVLRDVATARPLTVSWLPGERDEWANIPVPHEVPHGGWEAEVARILEDTDNHTYGILEVLAFGPEALVAPLVPRLPAYGYWNSDDTLRRILGRFGDTAAEVIFAVVQTDAIAMAPLLLPVTGTAITTFMTRLLDTRRGRATALAWFERHVDSAAPDLFAAALDKPGKQRDQAWRVLRSLDGRDHRAALLAAATALGDHVHAAIEAQLRTDPLELLPKTIPSLPSWLVPAVLSPIRLRDNVLGGRALPPSAMATVCTMLAMCGPAADYAGVARIADIATPRSLADFSWDLFEMWGLAGYPSDDDWVMHAQGLLGNDDTARRLAPLIRAWPGENAHARAVSGLDVLAAIGGEVSLMLLNGIAEKVKFKGIRTKAQEKIQQLAEESGMTAEELADRLVPSYGLDDSGTLTLDYGPRAFLIGFDEQLRPTVSDADGTPRRSLPKPGATDDPELAPAAFKTFSNLKKDVKAIAANQIQRLERAMVRGRRWTPEVHRQLFIDHPLLWHVSRRLVWASFAPDGTVTGSFRVAEDRTLADADDNTVTLADDALIGIAHPLHLAESLASWSEVFADYEILQPFPQLQREIHVLTEQSRAAALDHYQGRVVSVGKVLGMARHGWVRGAPMDGGVIEEIHRSLTETHTAVVDLEPGIAADMAFDLGDQKLSVHIVPPGQHNVWPSRRTRYSLADLDPIAASELLRDLDILTA
ncbi:DUF4132 domain-containing protein [Nocardia sp. NPDC050406]|uniref:DUF4132 domain-containing protein n=1 Tax=Nocardia sp. NPDC050406 TaxID=3364318 RepID=UPI00378D5221